MIDPASEIENKLHTHNIYYNNVINRRQSELGIIQDIYDVSKYKRFVESLPEETRNAYATLTFNTDGAPVINSSNYSIWPIYLMINELPIKNRFEELITCGVWFGKSKPDMNVFMGPFVKIINKLSNAGIKGTINGTERLIKLFPLCCCVDTIARAPLQGVKQFNGHYGCNWCLHYGRSYAKSMRYSVIEEPNPIPRNNEMHI